MIQLTDRRTCTGCFACVAACTQNAISVEADHLGHLYPVILQERCVGCRKCVKSCPVCNDLRFSMPNSAYAAWSLDMADRKTSASGGAASVFYQYALETGRWICGARYDEKCRVIHTVSRDPASIAAYKQSKYVFSDSMEVFEEIKTLLNRGERVLCISLPCKIAGLLCYLGKAYENLITVDIVCHGTPSQKNLTDHIRHVAPNQTDLWINFREDNDFVFSVKREQQVHYRKSGRRDTYLAAFLEGLNYRDSCYCCSYAKAERISDLTICDFWGLGQELPFDHPYTGSISAVLINTVQGKQFFEGCRDHLFAEERPVWEVIKGNAQLNAPAKEHPQRQLFEKEYQKYGFEKAVKTCIGDKMKAEATAQLWSCVKRALVRAAGIVFTKYRR